MGKTEKKTNSNCIPVKSNNNSPNFFLCLKFYESAIGPVNKCPAEIILICYLMMITSAMKVFLLPNYT